MVLRLLVLSLLTFAPAANASSFLVGLVSLDVLVETENGQPGVNAISILNLTGPEAITPDFPVTTSLLFLNDAII